MKRHLPGVLLMAMVVFLAPTAEAQGCAQRPFIAMRIYCEQNDSYCYSQECIDGGRDTDYCYEGFGECCDQQITTANDVCDVDECCGGGGTAALVATSRNEMQRQPPTLGALTIARSEVPAPLYLRYVPLHFGPTCSSMTGSTFGRDSRGFG